MTRSLVLGLAVLVALGATGSAPRIPWPGTSMEEYSCIMCHTEMRTDFLDGVHSRRGIQCTDCHGGDPDPVRGRRRPTRGISPGLWTRWRLWLSASPAMETFPR